MNNQSNYLFENLSRIGDDPSTNSQQNLLNVKHANYNLTNLNDMSCSMTSAIDTATKQPNVFFTGCSEVGPNGCHVDVNSNLKIGSIQNHPKCRIMLHPRPFITVPYLGKGSCNVDIESDLHMGDGGRVKKSGNQMSEVCLYNQETYPMLDSKKNSVTDTKHIIEADASSAWIRGGMPSREAFKNKKYNN